MLEPASAREYLRQTLIDSRKFPEPNQLRTRSLESCGYIREQLQLISQRHGHDPTILRCVNQIVQSLEVNLPSETKVASELARVQGH